MIFFIDELWGLDGVDGAELGGVLGRLLTKKVDRRRLASHDCG